MSEMVRRVSDALAQTFPRGWATDTDHMARVAIAAIREPTEKMVAAADGLIEPNWREAWEAMIDAALEDNL